MPFSWTASAVCDGEPTTPGNGAHRPFGLAAIPEDTEPFGHSPFVPHLAYRAPASSYLSDSSDVEDAAMDGLAFTAAPRRSSAPCATAPRAHAGSAPASFCAASAIGTSLGLLGLDSFTAVPRPGCDDDDAAAATEPRPCRGSHHDAIADALSRIGAPATYDEPGAQSPLLQDAHSLHSPSAVDEADLFLDLDFDSVAADPAVPLDGFKLELLPDQRYVGTDQRYVGTDQRYVGTDQRYVGTDGAAMDNDHQHAHLLFACEAPSTVSSSASCSAVTSTSTSNSPSPLWSAGSPRGKRHSAAHAEARVCANCKVTDTTLWRRVKNEMLCNPCGLYMSAHGYHRPAEFIKAYTVPRRRRSRSLKQDRVCAECSTPTTPIWRRDDKGRTVCNACGLYLRSTRRHSRAAQAPPADVLSTVSSSTDTGNYSSPGWDYSVAASVPVPMPELRPAKHFKFEVPTAASMASYAIYQLYSATSAMSAAPCL